MRSRTIAVGDSRPFEARFDRANSRTDHTARSRQPHAQRERGSVVHLSPCVHAPSSCEHCGMETARRLAPEDERLVTAAGRVIADNYDYERHHVGAAFRCRSGQVHTGIHMEADLGRVTVCAEPVALGAAYSAGDRGIDTIVAVAHPHPYEEATEGWVIPPCGMCREIISDFDSGARVIVPYENELVSVGVLELLPLKYSGGTPAGSPERPTLWSPSVAMTTSTLHNVSAGCLHDPLAFNHCSPVFGQQHGLHRVDAHILQVECPGVGADEVRPAQARAPQQGPFQAPYGIGAPASIVPSAFRHWRVRFRPDDSAARPFLVTIT